MSLLTTSSQTVGPYVLIGFERFSSEEMAPPGVSGERIVLAGRVTDGDGKPVNDGVVEVFDAANRLWGRCGTDADCRFSFVVPRGISHVEAYVFARGLLKHQLTRIDLSEAEREGGEVSFDIRLQGEGQTVFFAV